MHPPLKIILCRDPQDVRQDSAGGWTQGERAERWPVSRSLEMEAMPFYVDLPLKDLSDWAYLPGALISRATHFAFLELCPERTSPTPGLKRIEKPYKDFSLND